MRTASLLKSFNSLASKKRCLYYRRKLLEISQTVQALHMGGALSVIEILDFIYYKFIIPTIKSKNSNIFLMSKGHSCIAQYILLQSIGIIKKKDLDLYCKQNGKLGCHPDYGTPGIEASTGSLGHGMGLSVGIALANKIKSIKSSVFLIISDGELQEGSTWESMMMAANLELDNLVCFLDHNGSQSFGSTKITHPKFYPINKKVLAFNWDCIEVNGHNTNEINKKINIFMKKKQKKPLFVICNTVKGKGVKFMENKPVWHYRSPNPDEYKTAIKNLKL
jgi:transketolase